jgi:hypothetical protein
MCEQYNEPLTVGLLKELLKDVPDDLVVLVWTCNNSDASANVHVRIKAQYVALMGYKGYSDMTEKEKKLIPKSSKTFRK